jgi:hypothetical protein
MQNTAAEPAYTITVSRAELSTLLDCLHDVDVILRTAESAGIDPALDGLFYSRAMIISLADRLLAVLDPSLSPDA